MILNITKTSDINLALNTLPVVIFWSKIFETYDNNIRLGSMIIIDPETNSTCGACNWYFWEDQTFICKN